MTLKQLRLKSDLYHGRSKTMKDAALKAGYSLTTANTSIFELIKNPIYKDLRIDKDKMQTAFLSVADKAVNDKDYTNTNRSLENVCKINNLMSDSNITINVVDEVKQLYQAIDSVDSAKSVDSKDSVDKSTENKVDSGSGKVDRDPTDSGV